MKKTDIKVETEKIHLRYGGFLWNHWFWIKLNQVT